jgi:DNA polymerase-1
VINRPILVVDGLNLFMRHFIANPSMNESGDHIGGFIGFLKSLSRMCDRTHPKQVIVAWEGGGSPRRRAIYKDYKQNRRPQKLNRYYLNEIPDTTQNRDNQIVLAIEALKYTAVTQLYVPDCEADDVIGYLTKYKFPNDRYVIISSDKDLYQLLSKRVIQWSPGQKRYITPKTLIQKFGVSAVNFCTVRAFVGDSSDGIGGVSRAGFTSMSKRFPDLSENKFISVDDLIMSATYAREERDLKLYSSMIENAHIARRNWKLMYLDMIGLSADQIQKINFSIENSSPQNDKISLIRMFLREHIQNFDVDSFFASIQACTWKNK